MRREYVWNTLKTDYTGVITRKQTHCGERNPTIPQEPTSQLQINPQKWQECGCGVCPSQCSVSKLTRHVNAWIWNFTGNWCRRWDFLHVTEGVKPLTWLLSVKVLIYCNLLKKEPHNVSVENSRKWLRLDLQLMVSSKLHSLGLRDWGWSSN